MAHVVRLGGRAGARVRVADAAVPALLRAGGLVAHAARFAPDVMPNAMSNDPPGAPGVAAVVVADDPALGRAAPRRVAAYLAGRYCAARALAAATGRAPAVPVGAAGAPAWPAGVVGSISHAPSLAVAVVAAADRCRALGVDCEPVLDPAQADEIAALTLAEADAAEVEPGAVSWPEFVTVGFSAKETLYKCLRPLVGAFFDFPDAHLTRLARRGHGAGRVRLRLARDLAPGFPAGAEYDVRFALADGHVYTCLALPRVPAPRAPEPSR